MRIVYLGIGYPVKNDQNIYTDLMKSFLSHGHTVTVVCSNETNQGPGYTREEEHGIDVIRVKTNSVVGNTSLIAKGLATLSIDWRYLKTVKKALRKNAFDLILYSTPPITLTATIKYLKKKFKVPTYLMLKDIFPQNAVDIGMMGSNGILHKYFRNKEKNLYRLSDYIGCMSEANIEYLLTHNSYIAKDRVSLCVNSLKDIRIPENDKIAIRKKYGIPEDRVVFVFGGSLGRPQGIDFLIEFLKTQTDKSDRFYLICGKGSEAARIEDLANQQDSSNIKYYKWIPYEEYDALSNACDVGLILLDHRFSIPNFPSRLVTLLRNGMPILAATDRSTDVGKKIVENNCGWWCASDSVEDMKRTVDLICNSKECLGEYADNARVCFKQYYTNEITYEQIMGTLV